MTVNDQANPLAQLEGRIADGSASVAILGLGYVGLPLAVAFAEAGYRVVGIDTDAAKVQQLDQGVSYIGAVSQERLVPLVKDGRFSAGTDFAALQTVDVVIICVPTPLTASREPDLRFVEATTEEIANRLRPGQLIVLESTTYPGTTESVLLPRLESGGLQCGEDFLLAFSPEREDPGNSEFHTRNIPKVVGGVEPASTRAAAALYERVVDQVVPVSSSAVAEASKLTENIFRAVNIALVNELKVVYQRLGIDVTEVLDAAETKPFGFMRFNPGPGWGGHCIPVDPFYLQWRAKQAGTEARFIELAGEINIEMPRYVIRQLEQALAARSQGEKTVEGARVLVLGLAYKKNVADPRESPAFEVLQLLQEQGAQVAYFDPYFPQAPKMRSWPELEDLASVELSAPLIESMDAVVIVTDHDAVDYALVLKHASLIIDSRGVFRSGFEPELVARKVVPA